MTYVPTAATRNSIEIVKSFSYRGATRTFANRYHFEGTTPVDTAAWTLLSDAVTAAEKLIFNSTVEIVAAFGNDYHSATGTNLNGDAVFTKTYSLNGTASWDPTHLPAPGDCAAVVRYSTPARSVKNHPIYLFNYYHGVHMGTSAGDGLASDQKAAMETYADAWLTGFSDGTGARERCGPHGAVATARLVKPNISHRDFPA